MAVKGDREVLGTDWFYMDAVAEQGSFVCHSGTVGSGLGVDQTDKLVQVAANPSGLLPVGILLDEVVDVDTTQFELNQYRHQVDIGQPVTVMTRGWILLDNIIGTPSRGDTAYVTSSGNVMDNHTGLVNTPLVGKFRTGIDENGFAVVEINLP